MHRRFQTVLVLSTLAFLGGGCGNPQVITTEPEAVSPDRQILGKPIEISASDLLGKTRKELLAFDQDYADRVTFQKGLFVQSKESAFLARLHYPLLLPIFDEARFAAEVGVSLPPYLLPGTRDSAVAFHLARFGDLEGAKLLAQPSDLAQVVALHQSLYDRSYPVEWTRLIARVQHLGHYRLACGEREGATLLIELHKQLQQVLKGKAERSPLAGVLLREGKTALKASEELWRVKEKDLADQVAQALGEWGESPSSPFASLLGKPRAEVAAWFDVENEGSILSVDEPARALDLMALPIVREQVEGITACFNSQDALSSLVINYQPGVGQLYPDPAELVAPLEEQGTTGKTEKTIADARHKIYQTGKGRLDVWVLLQNAHVGALIALQEEKPNPAKKPLPRDFGIVHLDASFDHCRLLLCPRLNGDVAEAKVKTDREGLVRITHPLPALNPLMMAKLERTPGAVAIERLTVRGDTRRVPLHLLVEPLWEEFGPGQWRPVEDDHGGHFDLTWEDERTRYVLRLPNIAAIAPELELSQHSTGKDQAKRDEAALAFDLQRRQERIKAGKPAVRLPRSFPEVPRVLLGETRAKVERALPGFVKTPFGLRTIFTSNPPTQLLVRFGADDRVAELRWFAQDLHAKPSLAAKEMHLAYGATTVPDSLWASVWKDVSPPTLASSTHQWIDDLTIFTYHIGPGGSERILRDRLLDHPEGAVLPPLEFLSRGPEVCKLGQTRAEILANWKGPPPKPVVDDPLILIPAKPTDVDAYYLWFNKDKVIRVMVRYTQPATAKLTTLDRARFLQAAWAGLITQAGHWQRREVGSDKIARMFGWCDDRTRMRLFWQEDQGLRRLFLEWQTLAATE